MNSPVKWNSVVPPPYDLYTTYSPGVTTNKPSQYQQTKSEYFGSLQKKEHLPQQQFSPNRFSTFSPQASMPDYRNSPDQPTALYPPRGYDFSPPAHLESNAPPPPYPGGTSSTHYPEKKSTSSLDKPLPELPSKKFNMLNRLSKTAGKAKKVSKKVWGKIEYVGGGLVHEVKRLPEKRRIANARAEERLNRRLDREKNYYY